ncbi:hypothetical protein JB92DRAFT_1851810 [Gautieria morchelliformis]|nr:hypothetical protein JB92DRAFT_1851810 [Gautieria morchelliformis]
MASQQPPSSTSLSCRHVNSCILLTEVWNAVPLSRHCQHKDSSNWRHHLCATANLAQNSEFLALTLKPLPPVMAAAV